MTHKDIYTKFMIEYDKANVTSSYPSLTEYEVATVLDKAYNALIAQKVTGNNVRRSTLEADVKSISDLQPLIIDTNLSLQQGSYNTRNAALPANFLYYVTSNISNKNTKLNNNLIEDGTYSAAANVNIDNTPVKLINHDAASNFIVSTSNIPWIKIPVCYIENNKINVVYDPIKKPTNTLRLTYIKRPNTFVKDNLHNGCTFFDDNNLNLSEYNFECNSTVAEELVSLGVAFALENVESQRLNSKLNMRGLEA